MITPLLYPSPCPSFFPTLASWSVLPFRGCLSLPFLPLQIQNLLTLNVGMYPGMCLGGGFHNFFFLFSSFEKGSCFLGCRKTFVPSLTIRLPLYRRDRLLSPLLSANTNPLFPLRGHLNFKQTVRSLSVFFRVWRTSSKRSSSSPPSLFGCFSFLIPVHSLFPFSPRC